MTGFEYNTRVVIAGVTALGLASGVAGAFLLLRKRSLLSDTLSHCTLPGIALAFLVAEASGFSGRSLPWLLAGASVTGVLGMLTVVAIRSRSRVKDDAALAIVLSVFFGLGMAFLVLIQQLPTGNAAGLTHFIYGKAASLVASDARLILVASLIVAGTCALLFKEFKLLCFDQSYARSQGWPLAGLDLLLMGLVVMVTVVGLQAVGLLLVVAMLIIPAAAARFWTHQLGRMVVLAGVFGAASGLIGVWISSRIPKLPAGAVIVLAALSLFAISMVFGLRRGVLMKKLHQRQVSLRVRRQHLLRAIYEWCEQHATAPGFEAARLLERQVPASSLCAMNGWDPATWTGLRRLGQGEGLIQWIPESGTCQLTGQGKLEARRVTRNHRLWETYLLHYADVAPQHIHHNADQIEHVIEPEIVNHLEELLEVRSGNALVPLDPEKP